MNIAGQVTFESPSVGRVVATNSSFFMVIDVNIPPNTDASVSSIIQSMKNRANYLLSIARGAPIQNLRLSNPFNNEFKVFGNVFVSDGSVSYSPIQVQANVSVNGSQSYQSLLNIGSNIIDDAVRTVTII